MGITDETQFVHWYDTYKTYAPLGADEDEKFGNLEEHVQNFNGMSLEEFKRHLAEALMSGYVAGWMEGQYSLGVGQDHASQPPKRQQ